MREVSSESSLKEDKDDRSCTSTLKASSIIRDERYSETYGAKLPPFTGSEQWKVWYNRFESIANLINGMNMRNYNSYCLEYKVRLLSLFMVNLNHR